MSKSISHIIWHSLSQAVTHAINCDDEDCSALTETIHADTLKELEAIMQGVIGEPLVDDITWSPTLKDPYGRRHIMDTTKTPVAKTNINHGSYETIKRQYRRLRQALYGKEAEL